MSLRDITSWGVDVGNVLIHNIKPPTHQLTELELVKRLVFVPNALVGLRTLIQHVGPDNVWIISKASTAQAALTRAAFEKARIYPKTGLRRDQVLFCPERKDKRVIVKALELQGHIDDRGEVIASIGDSVKQLVWFLPTEEDIKTWYFQFTDGNICIMVSWREIIQEINEKIYKKIFKSRWD